MKNPSEKIKLTLNRALLGLALLLSAAVLVGYAGLQDPNIRKRPSEEKEQLTTEPLSSAFFQTKTGKIVLDYLLCIDFCTKAQQAVVKIGPGVVPPLMNILQLGVPPDIAAELRGDVPLLVRTRVISVLGALGDARALDPIIASLRDPSRHVRAAAGGALGQIGGDRALIALLPVLQDQDELVREVAAVAIGKLGRKDALPALHSAALSEPKAHVRKAIEEAILAIERR